MNKKIIFLLNILLIFLTSPSWGVVFYWQKQPQNERLVFQFKNPLSEIKVTRTGTQEISIILPADYLLKEPPPAPVDLSFSRLVKEVLPQKQNILIKTKDSAFGFISFLKKQENTLYLDVFYDPLGKKWTPLPKKPSPQPKKTTSSSTSNQSKPEKKKTPPAVEKKITPRASDQTPSTKPTPPKEEQQPISIPEKKPEPVQETKPPAPAKTPLSPANQQPLYKLKAPIKKVPIEQAVIIRPSTEVEKQASSTTNLPTSEDNNASSSEKEQPVSSASETIQTPSAPTPTPATTPQTAQTEPSAVNATEQTPDFEGLLITTKAAIVNGELDVALESLGNMIKNPKLPEKLKEEIYYLYADVLFDKYKSKLPEGFADLIAAYERAINYNPKSLRVPSALLNLGYIHLKLGNIPEARGYFNLLKEKYPYDPNIPLIYYYWGEFYFKQKQYQKAADELQFLITKFPDHKIAEDAAILLAKSLNNLEYYKQSLDIIKYLEQRWPRYYLKRPDVLLQAAYLYYKNKLLEEAKKRYLLYYNLLPQGEGADIALARVGDIFLLENKKQAAKKLYEEAVRLFPEKEGGLIAAMRLAEEGIYDQPKLKDMFTVFNRPFNLRPQQIYTSIIQKYPQSPLASLAQIKLAMWELFNKRPEKSLQVLKDFFQKPNSELQDKALEVSKEALEAILNKYTEGDSPAKILESLNKYPFLNQVISHLSPATQLLLASAYIQTNNIPKALDIIKPMLTQDPQKQEVQNALALALTLYLKLEDWDRVVNLGEKANKWPLSNTQKQNVDYALALAYQKKKQVSKSIPLWRKLAADIKLPVNKRAYALYFLASHYVEEKQWENVYIFAQEALSLFLQEKKQDKEKIIDCLKMLIKATSITGRTLEALSWALELKKYIPEQDPLWPSFQYQLADLYKLNGNEKAWQDTLKELIAKKANSLYAQLAKRDLSIAQLKEKANFFAPKP